MLRGRTLRPTKLASVSLGGRRRVTDGEDWRTCRTESDGGVLCRTYPGEVIG